MRSPVDALRSMNRYVALVLGDEWEVRLAADDLKSPSPFALVQRVGPTLWSGPAVYADAIQPMQVLAYPPPAATMESGIVAALAVEEKLFDGFRGMGVAAYTDASGPVKRTGRFRIPLYDYSGIPLDGVDASTDQRFAHDYMRVVDFSTSQVVDPTDDRNIVVIADIRVTWRRPTHADPGNAVESIHTEFAV